ncbi:MAG: amidohydrolase family protein [Rhodospirillaceae bacterium]|jgi:hypothetical protein|nr:amidohydrolase family protein [Rhodospirillaceae bacterium]
MGLPVFVAMILGAVIALPFLPARASELPIIDVHAHLHAGGNAGSLGGSADSALAVMDKFGITKALIMPPPQTVSQGHDETLESYNGYDNAAGRFAFLGGGGSLNVMIQEALRSGGVNEELQGRFRARAENILRSGAIGFGEMTAEHVSRRSGHPYVSAPPDHPLFLLLADIAAANDVPIDLHMEALPDDLPRPEKLSSDNPNTLRANIAAFGRLLSHNPKAKIIWAHAGWDNTGERTPDLMRELLAAHTNLYMSLKVAGGTIKDSRPVKEGKKLKRQWKKLIEDFPNRFMIGSDLKYRKGAKTRGGGPKVYRAILKRLSAEVADKVAYRNAERVFKISH